MSHPAAGRPASESVRPRFSGFASFLRLPVRDTAAGLASAVLGVPFDGGTTYRGGARFGPAALREASATLYAYHPLHRRDLFRDHPAADLGDVAVAPQDIGETLRRAEAAVDAVLDQDAFPLVLGGDHLVTLANLRAAARRLGPLGLVQLDSHHDLWNGSWGAPYSHATFHRRAIEEGLTDPSRSVVVGLRGSLDNEAEASLLEHMGVLAIGTGQLLAAGAQAVAEEVHRRTGGGPVWLTVDIDVVDPAFAPGTGTPEVGGPPSWLVLDLVRRLGGLDLSGADVVEIAPPYDCGQVTSLLGATLGHEILALRALRAYGSSAEAPGAR